ncbi:MAG: U32 family peptidase [Gemmatimonadaceae bacterium]|nr:U32 family peptidase [Gemmatimonadaceae bacterium]
MTRRFIPELLSPAGTLDAARAAIANGADAIYLGAERFNARDDGAQLTMEELAEACRLAHERGKRVYLTLNTLVKPAELPDALMLLGDAIDLGVDAAIVQDVGLTRAIQRVYPGFELHGSTQMTVHDATGAAVMHDLGLRRVVLARENTLDDIRSIRAAVPDLGLEVFVHGALCIAYSGQCFMSGMISERSANRGACAQSCRKDYTLTDAATGATLDHGFLISAKDLAASEHLDAIAEAGVSCLKVEGRKKKAEYVATVTKSYRDFLGRIERGESGIASPNETRDLVQIFSRGFTGGMFGDRAGREYITRDQPDNRGLLLGTVVGVERDEIIVELTDELESGDGIGLEPPDGGITSGFVVGSVRTIRRSGQIIRQSVQQNGHRYSRTTIQVGCRVWRTSHAALLQRARQSFAALTGPLRVRKTRLDIRVFGQHGSPLKVVFKAGDEMVDVRSEMGLAPATNRALDAVQLRTQLGRLGDTPFVLADVDAGGLAPGLFIPISELNRLRQHAVEQLCQRRDWDRDARLEERRTIIAAVIAAPGVEAVAPVAKGYEINAQLGVDFDLGGAPSSSASGIATSAPQPFVLAAEVYLVADAWASLNAGATEITFDPFLRHPMPPVAHVLALHEEATRRGATLRLRTPTIVRPDERKLLTKWLALGTPILSGHLGLVAELARDGRDVVADYAVNCFNQHTASEYFRLGAQRIVLSVELTTDEIAAVVAPWRGAGFDAVIYGRPEGMTIEHCVLSAAFDRGPYTCRDLCVQKHPLVQITDPAGYAFPVATDYACRNRLLHSRPIEASEFLPRLWNAGVRGYRMLFNVAGDPVAELVSGYRAALSALSSEATPALQSVRSIVGGEFTRGHFARAV